MPTRDFTPQFHRSFKKFTKHNAKLKRLVKSALSIFSDNPQHPSLNLEKLRGSAVWTIRVDKGNRLFFVWSETGDTAIFFFVGPHDSYRIRG